MTTIKERRSVRRYRVEKMVPEELLEQVLEAARWAPSWANTQCWEVIVVKDADMRRRLQEILGRNPAFDAMVQAPVVLVLCAGLNRAGFKKGVATTVFGDWFMYDLGIATQNICLAAHGLGLGTVIVGSFDQDKVGEVLSVPEGYRVVSMIPLGYPDGDSRTPPRREISDIRHDEKF